MLKKLLNLSFLVILFFLMIPSVFAAECTYEELQELKELSNKIQSTETFVESIEKRHTFDVDFYNLNNKFYLLLPNGGYVHTDKSSKTRIGNFSQGTTLIVEVYASNKTNCKDELLNRIEIQLKKFNEFSKRDECQNREDLEICQKWKDTSDITEEEFLAKIHPNSEEPQDENYLQILLDNWYFVVIGIVCVVIVIIASKKRKIKIDI